MASQLASLGPDARALTRAAPLALDPDLQGDVQEQVASEDAHRIARDTIRASMRLNNENGLAVTLGSPELSMMPVDSFRECLTSDAGDNFVEYTVYDPAPATGSPSSLLARPG